MIEFRPRDLIVVIGDSITAGSTGLSWQNPAAITTRAHYTLDTPPATNVIGRYGAAGVFAFDNGSPIFANLGIGGQTTNDLVTRLSEIYAKRPQGVVIAFETNDANGISNATFQSNVTAAVTAIKTASNYSNGVAPRWVAWMENACCGEAPWGTNPLDTVTGGLADKDAILRSRAPIDGFTLIETRTDSSGNGPWKTYEAANNPGGASYGYLTIDGIGHLTATGAAWQSALFMQSVSLTG